LPKQKQYYCLSHCCWAWWRRNPILW